MRNIKCLKLISALGIISLAGVASADYNAKSGKRKIAYAPHQTVSMSHVSPKKVAQVAFKGIDDLSQLSVEAIINKVKALPQNNQGMIAAGWPGGGATSQPTQQAPAGNPHAKAPAGNPHAKAPAGNPHANAPGLLPASQGTQPSLSGFVYGQLELDESLKSKVKAGSVLFVIVRRSAPKGQKGMMIAATKLEGITTGAFPLKYVVKQSDAMMGAPLAGKVSVSARIDQDGDAISKQPGDIIGTAEKDVMVGVNPVVIKLNKSL